MSRILFIYEQNMPTVSITMGMFERIARHGDIAVDSKLMKRVTPRDINENDIIVFIRPNDMLSTNIAKKAKAAGKTIAILLDDDLLHRVPNIPWRTSAFKHILRYADIIFSNEFIYDSCKKYAPYSRRVRLDTIVYEDQLSVPDTSEHRPVRVVYAANAGHVVMFDMYIKPILKELVSRTNAGFSLTVVGPEPDLTDIEGLIDIKYVKGMSLNDYRAFMDESHFDIGLAPLPDNSFTKCKYFNKYLEYTISGAFGVYSKVIPYTEVIRDGENGLLAENTYFGWLEALEKAITNRELRKNGIACAQEDMRRNFSEKAILERLFRDVPEMKNHSAVSGKCRPFRMTKTMYYTSRLADWSFLSAYYLKNQGAGSVLKKSATHLFRKAAYLKDEK